MNNKTAQQNNYLQTGAKAPDFTAPTDNGEIFTLSSLHGKNVALYFYPRDNTPGCTTEAKDFSSLYEEFQRHNTEIIGISKDTVAKHKNFKVKYNIPFTLISDAETDICENYGVWVEKSLYGKKFMGIMRSTFLINTSGILTHIWHKVKVKGHAEEVLSVIKSQL